MKWFINQPDVAGPNHKRIFLNFSQETLWILHQRPTHLACLAGHWLDVLLIHRVNAGPIDTIEGLKLVAPIRRRSNLGSANAQLNVLSQEEQVLRVTQSRSRTSGDALERRGRQQA